MRTAATRVASAAVRSSGTESPVSAAASRSRAERSAVASIIG